MRDIDLAFLFSLDSHSILNHFSRSDRKTLCARVCLCVCLFVSIYVFVFVSECVYVCLCV